MVGNVEYSRVYRGMECKTNQSPHDPKFPQLPFLILFISECSNNKAETGEDQHNEAKRSTSAMGFLLVTFCVRVLIVPCARACKTRWM